jgi:hypothetical protein
MQKICPECDRLWEEYTQAATAHLTAVVQHHKAVIQNQTALAGEIAPIEYDLAELELKTRRAISDHEATHESQ